jgi:hypothetical protein
VPGEAPESDSDEEVNITGVSISELLALYSSVFKNAAVCLETQYSIPCSNNTSQKI